MRKSLFGEEQIPKTHIQLSRAEKTAQTLDTLGRIIIFLGTVLCLIAAVVCIMLEAPGAIVLVALVELLFILNGYLVIGFGVVLDTLNIIALK